MSLVRRLLDKARGRTQTDGMSNSENTPKPAKIKRTHYVFTLLVEVGRKANDGLPEDATGAALMCYASGVDEEEAVRETVAVLKQADLNVLEVTGYGTLQEREAEGHDIDGDERKLMGRALSENSVVVAQTTVFREGDE